MSNNKTYKEAEVKSILEAHRSLHLISGHTYWKSSDLSTQQVYMSHLKYTQKTAKKYSEFFTEEEKEGLVNMSRELKCIIDDKLENKLRRSRSSSNPHPIVFIP